MRLEIVTVERAGIKIYFV